MPRPCLGEERRSEILAAFEACIIRKGFDRTSLADVAEASGQPRSLVRHHIGNRQEMVAALIDRLLLRSQKRIDRLQPTGGVDQMTALLMETVFDDPTTNVVIMELWHVGLRDDEVRNRLADVYRGLVDKVAAMIASSSTEPKIDERAFDAVCLAFGAGFFRYLGFHPPSGPSLLATQRALLAGIGASNDRAD